MEPDDPHNDSELYPVEFEPRLSVDLGPTIPMTVLSELISDAAALVDYAHLATADSAVEQALFSRNDRPTGSVFEYLDLLEADRAMNVLTRSADGNADPAEAVSAVQRMFGVLRWAEPFGDEVLAVNSLLRSSYGMPPDRRAVIEVVESSEFADALIAVQSARTSRIASLPDPLRIGPAQVQHLSYENPLTLDLVQGLPATVEVGALLTTFVATMKVMFGSGPKERAEASEIRARIQSEDLSAPTPTHRVLSAATRVQLYDWEIEGTL